MQLVYFFKKMFYVGAVYTTKLLVLKMNSLHMDMVYILSIELHSLESVIRNNHCSVYVSC